LAFFAKFHSIYMLFIACTSLTPRPARHEAHTNVASRTNTGVQAAGVQKAIKTG